MRRHMPTKKPIPYAGVLKCLPGLCFGYDGEVANTIRRFPEDEAPLSASVETPISCHHEGR